MPSDFASLDSAAIHKVIDRTRGELIVLHRCLAESRQSWAHCGFMRLRNPNAKRLSLDILDREELLQRSEIALVNLH
jgi:hypothetical protein